jgi:WD40 repeat protein
MIRPARTPAVLVLGLAVLSVAATLVSDGLIQARQATGKDKSDLNQKPSVDQKTISDLIRQLGDDSFDKREAAQKSLEAIGEPALELLKKVAGETTDAEVKQRVNELIRGISSGQIQLVRSIPWPEAIGGDTGLTRVVVTPDGKRAIVGTANGQMRCWDLDIGKELAAFGEGGSAIFGMNLSPDARRIVAACTNSKVRVFDVDTGQKLQTFEGHTKGAWGAIFLPGSKQILTGAWDKTLRVWDVETGKELRRFENVTDNVRCLALAPDGKTVAAGHFEDLRGAGQGRPGTVRIWNIETGRLIRTLAGHKEEVACVAFSRDGKLIASSSYDKTLGLWDVQSGAKLHSLAGTPIQFVEAAEFTPDGKRVVSCGTEGQFPNSTWTVRLWDVQTGKQLGESRQIANGVLWVAVLPDGHRCVTVSRDHTVRVWEWKI